MSNHYTDTVMDRAIFNQGLSVETVSVYILCCHLADIGQPVTVDNLALVWTGEPAALQASLTELEAKQIIVVHTEPLRTGYRIQEADQWTV